MVTLIRKDFRFCSKYVLIAITFSLAAPLVLLIDGDNLYTMLSFFIPMVVLGVVLGKICYIEDCEEARLFLRALPYKRRSLVLSKYIESIMLNVISFIYVGIAQYMLMKDVSFGVIFKINLIASAFFLVYYSIYLYLYFTRNYYIAQNTAYVVVGALLIFMMFHKHNVFTKLSNLWLNNSWFIYCVFTVALLLTFYSAYMVIARDKK